MIDDREVGQLFVDVDNDIWEYNKKDGESDQPWCAIFEAYEGYNPVKNWVLTRSPDENRPMMDILLQKAKMKEYDAYGFFRFNEGVFNTDKFYVKQVSGEKKYTNSQLQWDCEHGERRDLDD